MLGQKIQEVDRNCVIKIEAFMESLKAQFDEDDDWKIEKMKLYDRLWE